MVNPISGASPVSENMYTPAQQALTSFSTGYTDFQANPPDYNGAALTFKDALTLDKTTILQQYPTAYYLLGLAAQYSTPPDPNAKAYLQEYVNQAGADPSTVQSAKGQIDIIDGQAALANNDYQGALTAFELAGKDDPTLVPNLASTIGQIKGQIDLNNANEAQQKNDVVGMLKWYEQAAADCPEMAPELASTIAQLKPQVNFQQNDWPKIQAALQEAQGLVYPPQGTGQASDVPGAISLLQGLLQQYPDLADYTDPAMIKCPLAEYQAQLAAYPPGFQMQGHPERAIQIMQDAVAGCPSIAQQDPGYYFTMAQYAWQSGNVDQARDMFSKFGPYISQYQQAYGANSAAGVTQFAQQIGGSANAVLANFATYGASWLGEHTGISDQWWQNNVLGAASGFMPSVDRLNAINEKMRFGKHAFNEGYKVHGESDALRTLRDQASELQKARGNAKSSEEITQIEQQIEQNREEQKKVLEARTSGGEVPIDNPVKGSSSMRSHRWGTDVTTTEHSGAISSDPNHPDHINKGEGAAEDPSGPGFWGMGSTLQQAQAVYKTFGDISAANPYSLGSGGTGLDNYSMSASGGVNVLNAEERVFNMCYGGATAAGIGIHDMYGVDARADLADEQYGLNYAGGDLNIGGQNFAVANNSSLVNSSLSESAAIGTQANVHGGVSVGHQGVDLSGNTGAFAGVQTSGQVSANLLGQGGFAMAQAWAGVGAKLNANIAAGPGGLHFELGIGAALGVGGYIQLSANLNFEAMGQDLAAIYGTGNHEFTGMLSRTGELAASAVSSAGSMVHNMAGGAESLIGKAQDAFADNALSNIGAGGVKTLEGIGEGVGELATDVADATAAPILDAAKNIGHVASEVGSDLAQGKIGDALEDTVVGGAKAVWSTTKEVVDTAWHGIKDFFHGW